MAGDKRKPFRHAHAARPWHVKATDAVRRFMLSRGLQLAAQLATGQVVVTLFVVVKQLTFPLSCLASIFYVAAELLVAQDQHVGSHIIAGAIAIGHLILGSVFAGLVIMLARAPQVAYTTFLSMFATMAWVPIAALRAGMGPLALVVNLGFAFTILNAQLHWEIGKLWTEALLPAFYTALVAALGCIVSGFLTLPTLASDQLRDVLSATLQSVGTTVSGYASHLLLPHQPLEQPQPGGETPATKPLQQQDQKMDDDVRQSGRDLSRRITAAVEHPSDTEYQAVLRAATDPAKQQPAVRYRSHSFESVAALLPRIQLARRLLGEAMAEPPQLSRHRMQLQHWGPVLSAVETLILRCGALECVVEGREPLLNGARLQHVLGHDLMPLLRVLFAHVAACCNNFATTLHFRQGLKRVSQYGRLFNPSWASLEEQLAAALQTALMQGYWDRHSHVWREDPLNPPHLQVRALMFVATLTNEIMAAMAGVEDALERAAAHQTILWPSCAHRPHNRPKSSRAAAEAQQQRQHAAAAAVEHALLSATGSGMLRPGSISHPPSSPASGSGSVGAAGRQSGDVETPARDGAAATAAADSADAAVPSDNASSDVRHARLDGGRNVSAPQTSATAAEADSGSQTAAAGLSKNSATVPTANIVATASAHSKSRPFQRQSQLAAAPTKPEAAAADSGGKAGQAPPAAAEPWRWNKAWTINEVAWLKVHLLHLLCLPLIMAMRGICRDTAAAFKSWSALRKSLRLRKVQFFWKYFVLCAVCSIVIFVVTEDAPSTRSWNPLYVLFTVVVVLSEKVETTVQKGIFRALGTVIGGVVGYLAMLRPASATNPYALTVILCAWVFIGSFLALITDIRYAVFLTLITTEAVILCQYQPDAPAGFHGTAEYFYARVVDIAIGLVVVMAIDIWVLPWYSSASALETLGAGIEDACNILHDFHAVFYHALQCSALDSRNSGEAAEAETPAVAGRERKVIEERLGGRLAAVQVVLDREQVLWKRGYLAMPKVARKLQASLAAVLLRMTAVEAVLQQTPIITGRFTSTPFDNLAQAMQPAMTDLLAANLQVGEAVRALLAGDERGHCLEQLQEVDAALMKLEYARLQLRTTYLQAMEAYHERVTAGGCADRTPDDAVRWLSYTFSAGQVLDKIVLMANRCRADDWLVARCHQGSSSGGWRSRPCLNLASPWRSRSERRGKPEACSKSETGGAPKLADKV